MLIKDRLKRSSFVVIHQCSTLDGQGLGLNALFSNTFQFTEGLALAKATGIREG